MLCIACIVGFAATSVEAKSLVLVNGASVAAMPVAASASSTETTSLLKGRSGMVNKASSTVPTNKSSNVTNKSSSMTVTSKLTALSTNAATKEAVRGSQAGIVAPVKGEPVIRVLIKAAPQVVLEPVVEGKKISVQVDSKEVLNFSAGTKITASRKGSDIYLNNKKVGPTLTVTGDTPIKVSVDGRSYRGSVKLTTVLSKANVAVVNVVPMESYLYGVVPEEAPPSWHHAALEAQAVAARTYAYHAMQGRSAYSYDVESDTRSQVYKGMGSEYASTTSAVEATKGMVMTYAGKVINALFHSDSGGYTENSEKVWGNAVPYLKAVEEPVKGVNASTYRWTVTTDKVRLESVLKQAGKDVGSLKSIQLSPLGKRPLHVADRGTSGRVISMVMEGSKGKATITGEAMMGYLGLRSTLFDFYVGKATPVDIDKTEKPKAYHTFSSKNDTVVIQGYGWGHGLGMSQWGAQGMARESKTGDTEFYKKILLHYYSGVSLQKLY